MLFVNRVIVHLPALVVLGGWFLLQVFSQISVVGGAGGGVAYMAHIGGFVAGVAMILDLRRAPARWLAGARGGWSQRRPLGQTRASGTMIDDLWYKNAVFYCLDVGTFMDANGDGIGDFEGLLRRLDYLAGLGVTALWLQPFQPSPNHDDGYDTADYYGVDPRHGSLGDFVEFTQQARQRGIRVIIDLVINHTSDQHPWFKAARRDQHSQYRDYYYWSKKKPPGANKGMVFPGVQKTTWTYDKEARGLLPPPLLQLPARPQRREPGGAGGDPQDHGLLAGGGGLRLPRRRRPLHHRDRAPGSTTTAMATPAA